MKLTLPTITAAALLLAALPATLAAPSYTTTRSSTTTPRSSTTTIAKFCTSNAALTSCLRKSTSATPYCSSVLSIKPTFITTTTTIQPSPRTSTVTVTKSPGVTSYTTVTVSVTITGTASTATVTATQTVITTSTTTTSTQLTCLTTGSTQSAINKRSAAATPATCACFAKNYPSASISAACSCLGLTGPTSTSTVTVTGLTSVVLTTVTTTPTTMSTIYTTTTIIQSAIPVTSTTTTSVTSTVIATATSTSFARNGVYYRNYNSQISADDYLPHYPSDNLHTATDNYETTAPDVNFDTNAVFYAAVLQGFFIAPQSGVYTFFTNAATVDNWEVVWIGDAAYTWLEANKSYDASRTSGDADNFTGGSISVTLTAGDQLPITVVWANADGPGISSVSVFFPDDSEQDSLADYLIQACGPIG